MTVKLDSMLFCTGQSFRVCVDYVIWIRNQGKKRVFIKFDVSLPLSSVCGT